MFEIGVLRGGFVDSRHLVAACAVGPAGDVLGSSGPGDEQLGVFLRSAAKPFQASAAVAAGVLERYGLSDAHLAVACSSHHGDDRHVRLVHEMLDSAGLSSAALQCGDDGQGGPIQHQCSGNHALGLLLCVASGWPIETYLETDHPLQQCYREVMSVVLGAEPDVAPDGCGMRAYWTTLQRGAMAFGRLGSGWRGLQGLSKCADAMRRHPELVRWLGEPDTELMRADTRLVSKVGAEAIVGVGHHDGRGLLLRVIDGSSRAWSPAVVYAVRTWLVPNLSAPGLDPLAEPPVFDAHGRRVGLSRYYQRPVPALR